MEIDLLSPSEAIRTFLDNDLLPNAFTTDHVGQFPGPSFFRNSDNFRDLRMYYEEVNSILCANKDNLRQVFDFYARGDGTFSFATSYDMSLLEWKHFATRVMFVMMDSLDMTLSFPSHIPSCA